MPRSTGVDSVFAPVDAGGLDAQQRAPGRQAVLEPRHIEQVDQSYLMNGPPARVARNRSMAPPSNSATLHPARD
jgi:hypothetical protein